uniref:COesterase domain-containing protein n=1 Tax=Caenorhabditis japonica TaxID=281687 RepID=A0A8R1IQB3_CAEJA
MLRWFVVLLICSVIAAQQQQSSNYVTVNCSQGPVQGRQVDLGNDNSQLYSGQANVYTGIPYCQPPVDNLRFQPPQPLTTFNTSLLNATYFRPKCPQLNAGAPTNEDCLYLNIYTPQVSNQSVRDYTQVECGGCI